MHAAWRLEQDGDGRSFCLQLHGEPEEHPGSEHLHQQWFFWARTEAAKQKIAGLLSIVRSPPSLSLLSGTLC